MVHGWRFCERGNGSVTHSILWLGTSWKGESKSYLNRRKWRHGRKTEYWHCYFCAFEWWKSERSFELSLPAKYENGVFTKICFCSVAPFKIWGITLLWDNWWDASGETNQISSQIKDANISFSQHLYTNICKCKILLKTNICIYQITNQPNLRSQIKDANIRFSHQILTTVARGYICKYANMYKIIFFRTDIIDIFRS